MVFPGESLEYRTARDRLLEREIELRRAMEDVAALRRRLPLGGRIPEDYVFQGVRPDGTAGEVRLSELFGDRRSLAIYCFMFPRDPSDRRPGAVEGRTAKLALAESPCPSCTALLDQLDGTVEHVSQHMSLAVVAKAPLDRLLDFARERGWRRLRLLSRATCRFGRDYFGEDRDGVSLPMLTVFQRDDDGAIRHFWSSELFFAPIEPGQDPRHVGTIEPVWNLFDLTREGRGERWEEQISYCCDEK
jgi:predicted dithiol-disulfide oxidoreductase (DUF899 family)